MGYTLQPNTTNCIKCHEDCSDCYGGNTTRCTMCTEKKIYVDHISGCQECKNVFPHCLKC